MKVHKSNFYMEGFVEEVKAEELLSLGLPVYYDAGSGLLMDLRKLGINYEEPSFEELIKKGLHLVSGSGDKLLGGPQAGLILGKREFVEPLKKNPPYCVAIKHQRISPQELYKWLLKQEPPVVGRLRDDLLLLDMRTVLEEDIKPLISVLKGLEF
jgi:seryl-tRNA(Sec) selenium transferase